MVTTAGVEDGGNLGRIPQHINRAINEVRHFSIGKARAVQPGWIWYFVANILALRSSTSSLCLIVSGCLMLKVQTSWMLLDR